MMQPHFLGFTLPKVFPRQPVWAVVAALGALVFVLAARQVWQDVAPWGIGVSHDSIYYLNAARNILAGNGVYTNITGQQTPMTHYPPLYPTCLAIVALLTGTDPLHAARLLAVFLMGANVLLISYLVLRYTAGNLAASGVAAGMALVSHAMVMNHNMAWSEPLFLFLTFGGIVLLDHYLTSGNRVWLLGTGICFALAILTRYVGLMLIPFAGLAVVLFNRESLRRRLADAFWVMLPAMLLTGTWMFRNRLLSGSSTNRHLQFLGFGPQRLAELKETIKPWFFQNSPTTAGFNRTLLLMAVLVVLLVLLHRHEHRQGVPQNRSKLAELVLLFGLLYLGFLIVSVTWVDASTPLDQRMLVPFFVSLLCLLACVSWRWIETLPLNRPLQALLAMLFAVSIADTRAFTAYFHNEIRAHGEGFTSKDNQGSAVAAALRQLPPDAQIYAGGYDNVYLHFLSDRHVRELTDLTLPDHSPAGPVYAAFLSSCCPDGQAPAIPAPYVPGEALLPRHLYPLQKTAPAPLP